MDNLFSRSGFAGAWLAVLALVACSEAPRELSLQLLASEQGSVDGHLVITHGVVRSFDDPLHYWLEDESLNRVALSPDDAVADYLGEFVEVHGRFHADRERGRRIEVTQIQRSGQAAAAL